MCHTLIYTLPVLLVLKVGGKLRVRVKVLPIQATTALRVGTGIAVRYLRPRH